MHTHYSANPSDWLPPHLAALVAAVEATTEPRLALQGDPPAPTAILAPTPVAATWVRRHVLVVTIRWAAHLADRAPLRIEAESADMARMLVGRAVLARWRALQAPYQPGDAWAGTVEIVCLQGVFRTGCAVEVVWLEQPRLAVVLECDAATATALAPGGPGPLRAQVAGIVRTYRPPSADPDTPPTLIIRGTRRTDTPHRPDTHRFPFILPV